MARLVPLLLVWPLLCGFIPFSHQGMVVLPMSDGLVEAPAKLYSEVSKYVDGVVVRADFLLPGSREGFLTMDVKLGRNGEDVEATWRYYEKTSLHTVSFHATSITGRVRQVDRFEAFGDTSLHLEFSAELSDGLETITITDGYAVTSPAPWILRTQGDLPQGVVVVDDGSGAFQGRPVQDRQDLDCTGGTNTVVIFDDETVDDPYWNEEIIIVERSRDSSGNEHYVYDDISPHEPTGSESYYLEEDSDGGCLGDTVDSGYEEDAAYSDSGCGGDSSSSNSGSGAAGGCSDEDPSLSGSENSGGLCEGDAVAYPRRAAFVRAPVSQKWPWYVGLAHRVLRLSPLLFLLIALGILRELGEHRRFVGVEE